MAGQVINGGDLMLFIDDKSIAFATSHKLSINVETVETTSIKAVFCLEKDYSTKKDEVPEGGWLPATTGTYSGNVIITALEANAPNGDNATFTASFEGVGALTKAATA